MRSNASCSQSNREFTAADRARDHPAWGEDIKIMAVRSGEGVKLTIACAMIGRFLNDMDSYLQQKAALAEYVRERRKRARI
ncbi:hypothetical protein BRDID11002_19130 [Bradyrhizobium diazoefficiens]